MQQTIPPFGRGLDAPHHPERVSRPAMIVRRREPRWGIGGHANTNDELVALARAELSGTS